MWWIHGALPWPWKSRRHKLKRSLIMLSIILVILWMMWPQDYYIDDNDRKLKIYVVEEHHEVLPYWFHSAVRKTIGSTGNTLVHIDAHSDMGQPSNFPGYPAFHWPTVEEETETMMQKNDVFIQAAAMAGLINRIIWIWPSWDTSLDLPAEVALSLGWYKNPMKPQDIPVLMKLGHTGSLFFCECNTNVENRKTECSYLNDTGAMVNEVVIPQHQCYGVKNISVENVRDFDALELLKAEDGEGRWLSKKEKIILDIDEDFFGCERGTDPLLASGHTWKGINYLNLKISKLFCPQNVVSEELADILLKDCIHKLMLRCGYLDQNNSVKENSARPCVASISQVYRDTIQYINEGFNKPRNKLYCTDVKKQALTHWKEILLLFYHMNPTQLESLAVLGFCFSFSPATLMFSEIGNFRVCHGVNTPNNTLVTLHASSHEEIMERVMLLKEIITYIPREAVKVTTVCRSIRDGFTPKHAFENIENGILYGLHSVFGKDNVSVLYDGNLLGGDAGFPSRYVPLN